MSRHEQHVSTEPHSDKALGLLARPGFPRGVGSMSSVSTGLKAAPAEQDGSLGAAPHVLPATGQPPAERALGLALPTRACGLHQAAGHGEGHPGTVPPTRPPRGTEGAGAGVGAGPRTGCRGPGRIPLWVLRTPLLFSSARGEAGARSRDKRPSQHTGTLAQEPGRPTHLDNVPRIKLFLQCCR